MLKDFQFKQMLVLQDKLNSMINPNWVSADDAWLLAGSMELAECIDHIGWKWWKKQVKNLPLAQNELIDYWHFVLSHSIIKSDTSIDSTYVSPFELLTKENGNPVVRFDDYNYFIEHHSVIEKINLLIGLSVSKRTHFQLFQSIMADCELTWEELYKQYIAKNVLNIFRQNHGYKDGSYIKTWHDGREDNLHMLEILEEYKYLFETEEFLIALEHDLDARYQVTVLSAKL